jgi:hypothetical protein
MVIIIKENGGASMRRVHDGKALDFGHGAHPGREIYRTTAA